MKDLECPVCMELFGSEESGGQPTTLPCGHSLCISHIPHVQNCPVCRAPRPPVRQARPAYALAAAVAQVYRMTALWEASSLARAEQGAPEEGTSSGAHASEGTEGGSSAGFPSSTAAAPADTSADEDYARQLQAQFDSLARPPVPLRPLPTPPVLQRQSSGSTMRPCGHRCQLTLFACCEDTDLRPVAPTYEEYKDGVGWVMTATRHQHYCPTCRTRLSAGPAVQAAHDNNNSGGSGSGGGGGGGGGGVFLTYPGAAPAEDAAGAAAAAEACAACGEARDGKARCPCGEWFRASRPSGPPRQRHSGTFEVIEGTKGFYKTAATSRWTCCGASDPAPDSECRRSAGDGPNAWKYSR